MLSHQKSKLSPEPLLHGQAELVSRGAACTRFPLPLSTFSPLSSWLLALTGAFDREGNDCISFSLGCGYPNVCKESYREHGAWANICEAAAFDCLKQAFFGLGTCRPPHSGSRKAAARAATQQKRGSPRIRAQLFCMLSNVKVPKREQAGREELCVRRQANISPSEREVRLQTESEQRSACTYVLKKQLRTAILLETDFLGFFCPLNVIKAVRAFRSNKDASRNKHTCF